MTKLWGGRFEGELDPYFDQFNRSLPFDQRMVLEDIDGSIAWAEALGGAGVLTGTETKKIAAGLRKLRARVDADGVPADAEHEDVHAFVEHELRGLVGDLAKKLHTGRSRNDQVATDIRLWLRKKLDSLDNAAIDLQRALAVLAERHADLAIPGYTHLQRAQPVTVGHHALAYVEMLARDRERLADVRSRVVARSPLGSGALAGTAFPIDRKALAKSLGFAAPTANSLDAVSDRDHIVETVFVCSLMLTHLSRLCEDWIFYGSFEARFLRFGDAAATGSSLMPQKKNPDGLELVRGKVGRVQGHLQALLTTIKGLPLAYNKDLQEDKEALFDALDTTEACLDILSIVVDTIEFDEERCRAACETGFLNATDLADLLVREGVPFRDAHDQVGLAVRRAVSHGCELHELPDAVLQELFPGLAGKLRRELSVDRVLARRSTVGGTAPARVRAAAKRWLKKL